MWCIYFMSSYILWQASGILEEWISLKNIVDTLRPRTIKLLNQASSLWKTKAVMLFLFNPGRLKRCHGNGFVSQIKLCRTGVQLTFYCKKSSGGALRRLAAKFRRLWLAISYLVFRSRFWFPLSFVYKTHVVFKSSQNNLYFQLKSNRRHVRNMQSSPWIWL